MSLADICRAAMWLLRNELKMILNNKYPKNLFHRQAYSELDLLCVVCALEMVVVRSWHVWQLPDFQIVQIGFVPLCL